MKFRAYVLYDEGFEDDATIHVKGDSALNKSYLEDLRNDFISQGSAPSEVQVKQVNADDYLSAVTNRVGHTSEYKEWLESDLKAMGVDIIQVLEQAVAEHIAKAPEPTRKRKR